MKTFKLVLMSMFCRRALDEMICGHFDVMSARVRLSGIWIAVPCLGRKISKGEIETFINSI